MFCILVNDVVRQYAYVPTHSNFGLGSEWVPCTLQPDGKLIGDWENPCALMISEVGFCVAHDYTRVNLVDLVGRQWVTSSEYRLFMELYKTKYAATQRLGQAFLNYFSERFTEPWPELFYCESNDKAYSILRAKVF